MKIIAALRPSANVYWRNYAVRHIQACMQDAAHAFGLRSNIVALDQVFFISMHVGVGLVSVRLEGFPEIVFTVMAKFEHSSEPTFKSMLNQVQSPEDLRITIYAALETIARPKRTNGYMRN